VPALLHACEAGALMPTRNEGLSNTILEYMAAGLPVLATDCGGNRELVRDGETGRLLPVSASPAELAAAWIGLLRQPEQAGQWGRNGRRRVDRQHAPGVALDAFAALYRRLAAGSADAR
jgi:glycosyltransferase involved in cell wall biosynthesis